MIKIIFQSYLKTHRWINLFEFTWFLLPKWLLCLHQMWLHANIKLINIFADNIRATILSTNVLASHLKLSEIWNTLENWANRYMSLFTTRHHLWHDKACSLNMIFWAKIEGDVFFNLFYSTYTIWYLSVSITSIASWLQVLSNDF